MTDAELIRAAIQASGLSARRFARTKVRLVESNGGVDLANERTVRNWLAGDSAIHPIARAFLESVIAKAERAKIRSRPSPSVRDATR